MNYSVFDSFPQLTTQRLTLQLHKESDVDDLYELRSNPQVMTYMDKPLAQDKSVVLKRIRTIREDFENRRGINWTIKLKELRETIGYMSLWRIDHTNHRAELGYALKPSFWGQGIAIEAAKSVIDFAFDELQVHSIMANVNPQNTASQKLLLKLGFQKEAHFREDFYFNGKFLDSCIYGLLLSDWRS